MEGGEHLRQPNAPKKLSGKEISCGKEGTVLNMSLLEKCVAMSVVKNGNCGREKVGLLLEMIIY